MTTSESIWLGEQARPRPMAPEGRYLDIDGEPFYCIENVDEMDEFLSALSVRRITGCLSRPQVV